MRQVRFVLVLSLFHALFCLSLHAQYSYTRAIVIDYTKVQNTDQSNFPILVSGTYSYLATVANGGEVQNSNGYDIIFTTDVAGTSQLDHEIESYDPVTGTVNFWVRIPTLSHTVDTVIYMQYGNSGISTSQEHKTTVWDSNFQEVLHLSETSGTTVSDSTANANNGSKVSSSSPAPASGGKIGGTQSFNGTSDYITLPSGMTNGLTTFSVSFWTKTTDTGSSGTYWNQPSFVGDSTAGGSSSDFGIVTNSGDLGMWSGLNSAGDNAFLTSSVINDNNWHHVEAVDTGSLIRLYLDGADTGETLSSGLGLDSYGWYLGAQHYYGGGAAFYHQGDIDEFRFSNSARSADWVATEYKNQNSPSTFYSVGSENAVNVWMYGPTAVNIIDGGQTQQFTALVTGSTNTAVTWSISPSVGSINSSGVYTAPSTITSQQTITITATSSADGTKTATATVTLLL